jgi:hypothetical protein
MKWLTASFFCGSLIWLRHKCSRRCLVSPNALEVRYHL